MSAETAMSSRRLIFAVAAFALVALGIWWLRASNVLFASSDDDGGGGGAGGGGRRAIEPTSELRVGFDDEQTSRPPHRSSWSGAQFPEGVLALTWDDGPDVQTLALARYLSEARVTATFFVVGDWIDGVSDEPGVGAKRFETGYRKMPTILSEIAALGHRLGTHTENHTLLTGISTAEAAKQLADCQKEIDPFVKNELRLFRAPGGAWDRELAVSIGRSDLLAGMTGPIRWDIDAKDWDRSLYCRDSAAAECEPSPARGERRVRAAVIAKRYVDEVVSAKRGIVLLHDRVGAVGTSYALDVALALIPELIRRDYVFAAPVLSFSDLKPRPYATDITSEATFASSGEVRGDLNGDGRVDSCVIDLTTKREVRCALAGMRGPKEATVWASLPPDATSAALIDINQDTRTDLCITVRGQKAVLCGLAP